METIELRELIRPLRRWWWLLLLSTILAAATSYWYASQQPQMYESRATAMVGGSIRDPNPSGFEFYLQQQLVQTYADLISRAGVRRATQEALGMTWLPAYVARTVPNTQLLELVVMDTEPQRAQLVADELIRQLIVVSPAGAQETQRQDFVNRELDELQVGIDETKAEIKRRQEELTGLFSARQIADAEVQIEGLQNKLSTLQSNFTELLATTQKGAVNTINVIELPQPGTPIANTLFMNVLLAAAFGFVLAAGGAFLLEYLDDTLKNSDDVQKHIHIAALGAVPLFSNDEREHDLIMLTKSQSPVAESYRVLRTNLQFASVAHKLQSLMITSAAPGEGKSATAANLAVAMAQAGKRIVLIDADLHRPRLHKIFKLVNNVGLTTALLDEPTQIDRYLHRTLSPTLRVLTTGPLPPNPAELVGSQRMSDLLRVLEQQTDMIILDCPPATAVADTAVLATQTDGVLLVVNTGKTRRELVKRALSALKQVDAHIVGCLLNRMPTRGSGYYYYYHYKYYRQYYRRDDEIQANGPLIAQQPPLLRSRKVEPTQNGHQPAADEQTKVADR